MAKLTSQQRKRLAKNEFAIREKAPKSGSYPIDTKARARNALARAAQHGSPAEKARVRAAVKRRYPEIQQKSTKGSPAMTPAELNQGYRSLGKCT